MWHSVDRLGRRLVAATSHTPCHVLGLLLLLGHVVVVELVELSVRLLGAEDVVLARVSGVIKTAESGKIMRSFCGSTPLRPNSVAAQLTLKCHLML
jgi:hypothetical protein